MNFYSTKALRPTVTVLIFLSVLSWNTFGGDWNTLAIAETASAPQTSEQFKPGEPLPNATTISTTPINKKDFFSGNQIKNGDVTTLYKEYLIGFCCNNSKRKWDNLPETQKDAFVQLSLSAK